MLPTTEGIFYPFNITDRIGNNKKILSVFPVKITALIRKVSELIKVHEEGGGREADLLKDADSLSFLEINVPMFISRVPKMLSKEEVRDKFDYMFNRITSLKAKRLAKPLYAQAISKLNS